MDDLFVEFKEAPLKEIEESDNIIHINIKGGGHVEFYSGKTARFWGFELGVKYFKAIH